jgi:F-type H+-transporting ATPase subunit delta
MIQSTVAQRYAQALLDLAITKKSEDQFYQELLRVQKAFDQSADLRNLYSHPRFDIKIRKSILESILSALAISPTCSNFLFLLTDKGRMRYLGEIVVYYQKLLDQAKGRIRATVITAVTLNPVDKSRLKLALEKLTKKEVILVESVDKSIIGGIVTKIEGKVYDGSIRTQLDKLTIALNKHA